MEVKKRNRLLLLALAVLGMPFAVPERARVPVQGASSADWNKQSFWYEPWGASGVHKGIDIFAPSGRPIVAPVYGTVIFRGRLRLGGNVIAVLGPKWRIHYFAHLRESHVHVLEFVAKGDVVGTVGTSGNAAGKAPHLHYAILQLIPRVWQVTRQAQGWKRMFFVDPGAVISQGAAGLTSRS